MIFLLFLTFLILSPQYLDLKVFSCTVRILSFFGHIQASTFGAIFLCTLFRIFIAPMICSLALFIGTSSALFFLVQFELGSYSAFSLLFYFRQ